MTIRTAVPTLDLAPIMSRVAKECPDWSAERLMAAEYGYRVFLAYMKTRPNAPISVPSYDVDVVWHVHILHTQKYQEDCFFYLGRFLHHLPFDDEHPWVLEKDRSADLFRECCGDIPPGWWSSSAYGDRGGQSLDYQVDNPPPCSGNPYCSGNPNCSVPHPDPPAPKLDHK